MSGLAGTWSAALAALEADVEELDRALRDGATVAVSSWQQPNGDLGPMPEHLAPRAEQLVNRIAEVRERGRSRLTEYRRDLDELGRRRDAGAAYSSSNGTTNTSN